MHLINVDAFRGLEDMAAGQAEYEVTVGLMDAVREGDYLTYRIF